MSMRPSYFQLFIKSVDIKMHWRTAVAVLKESLKSTGNNKSVHAFSRNHNPEAPMRSNKGLLAVQRFNLIDRSDQTNSKEMNIIRGSAVITHRDCQ